MASIQPFELARTNGMATIFNGVSTWSRTAQAIAGELAKMSEENLGAGAKAAERLRDAKSMQDITAIQTDLVKESIEHMNDHCRKIAEIAVSTPQEVAKSYRELFSVISETGSEIINKASDVTRQMGDQAADAVHQTTDAGRHGAESVRQARR